MEVILGLIPLMLVLGIVGVVIFFWTVRSGQYDDLEGDAHRILMDDDDPLLPENQPNKTARTETKKENKNWPDAD